MTAERGRTRKRRTDQERRKTVRRERDRSLLRRERELEAARQVCEALFQQVNPDRLVEETLRTALDIVGAEAGSILLADPERKQLVFRHSIGVMPVQRGTVIPWDRSIAGTVFKLGKPQVIADARQDPRHYEGIDAATGYQTHDMVSIPLKRWEGEPIGVLNVLNKRAGRLGEEDLAILTLVSAFAAITIEQARRYEEAKLAEVARLLGDLSHDLKNLLMPFITGAGLLRGEVTDLFTSLPATATVQAEPCRASCDEVVGMLLDSARRIKDRVQEIADCVKGRSAPPQFAPCRVEAVVESVFRTLHVLADEKGVALRAKELATLPVIVADERRLFNALYNLVNNAVAEVPTGGSVTVQGCAEPAQEVVVLSVSDTGRGMPKDVRESLFTPQVISRKAGGTGLGTKIVKDVVDAHGGQITVESAEGVGTTFRIRLPIQQADLSEAL